jgi:hypothetical protein
MRMAWVMVALTVSAQAQSGSKPSTPATDCVDYPSKLDSCTPYSCTFTHPITGGLLERKIVGLSAGKCVTTEAMPGKHTMQCALPADVRKAVATFFKETQSAEAKGKTIGGKLETGGDGKPRSTSTVDGQPVVNPLQQALEAGVCKIG